MAHNVKVVYDVFGVAIKERRSSFSNPKNVAEQNTTKGVARLGFCGARAAFRRRSVYNPVMRRCLFNYIPESYPILRE
jgi:hypothetical protein